MYNTVRTGARPPQIVPQQRLEVVVQRGNGGIQPRNMRRDVLREARVGPRQAILFRSPHADQVLAPPQEGAQLLRLGVGQWARRWADHVGKMGQSPGIQRLRFRELPRGPSTIPDLTRVHDDDG